MGQAIHFGIVISKWFVAASLPSLNNPNQKVSKALWQVSIQVVSID